MSTESGYAAAVCRPANSSNTAAAGVTVDTARMLCIVEGVMRVVGGGRNLLLLASTTHYCGSASVTADLAKLQELEMICIYWQWRRWIRATCARGMVFCVVSAAIMIAVDMVRDNSRPPMAPQLSLNYQL